MNWPFSSMLIGSGMGRNQIPMAQGSFWRQGWNKAIQRFFSPWTNRDKSKALGFTQLYPSFSSIAMRPIWVLNDLFVVESARKMGVARSLLKEAERFARETNAARLILATANDNHAVQALYEKLGWAKDDEFLHYKYNL
jgi:GNAT superfamily N-acetyltransferase